ncbi:MAG: hypothetical protein ACYSW3_26870 [Planctomycetota bacterium]|jgi:hypothetical protein
MPQTVTIDGFGGGINQLVPAVDIRDNEVVDAKNMEIDGNRTLRTRPGLSSISGAYTFGSSDVLGMTYFKTSAGNEWVVAATAAGIHEADPASTTWADIEGGYGLATAERWEFAVLNDILIMSNMQDVLLKWSGSGNIAALGGTPAASPLSIAVMDNRLFYVDKASPNTLRWSALGAPEDHTTTGKTGSGSWNVGGAEGDRIVRIFPHRGRLFIFKENLIYTLIPGAPREDSDQWQIPMLINGVGLAAPDSVQVVRDDVIFLSHNGILSLGATEQYGDWKQADMSRNIVALTNWTKTKSEQVRSIIHPNKQQYLISIPQNSGDTTPTVTWVLDFTEGIAWTRYTGDMAAQSFARVMESGVPRLYVGNSIVTREDETVWQDNSVSYEKLVLTKSYSLGETMRRKIFHHFGVQFEALTDPLTVEILYRLDQDSLKAKTITYAFSGLLTGGYWDEGLWDTAYWSSELTDLTDLIYRIQGGPGRRGQLIDFRYRNNANEAFGIKRKSLDVTLLDTIKHVSE